jgi:hypothetical protein
MGVFKKLRVQIPSVPHPLGLPMKNSLATRVRPLALGFGLALLSSPALSAALYHVYTTADFIALPTLAAGDAVVVHDGIYAGVGSKTISGAGTAAQPIAIYAEHVGGAAFSGQTHLVLSGSYLSFAGFKFDGQTAAGGMPPAEKWGIVQTAPASSDCRITNCMFRDFNDGAVAANTYYWLVVQGYRHTVEYNSFEGKTTIGASIVVATPEADTATPRNHLFHFNYFGPRTVIGSNGYEGIRNGDSAHQNWNMASVVEFNYFYRAIYGSGEPELISNKSSNNTYRYNTFVENRGQICLRHGDNCVVEGNFFFGANLADAGGVRIVGQNHLVRNNYFQDLGGVGVTSSVVVQKGDPAWPASDDASTYEVANNAKIFHNTFVNCNQPIYLGRNSSGTGAIDPSGVEFRNNVVQSATGAGAVFNIGYATSAIAFSGDIVYHPDDNYGVTGLAGVTYGPNSPELNVDAALGYAIPSGTSPVLNAATSTSPATNLDIRGLLRPGSGQDIGSYEREVAGPGLPPLQRGDVGPSYFGGPADTYVPPGTTVAVPTFNPAGGTYASAQTVAISTATSGAAIRYTLDGSAPTATTGTVYAGPLTIAASTTVRAIAYKTNYVDSAVITAAYTIQALAPTATPAGGTYTASQSVTLATGTSGATIRYTLDGSTPSSTVGTIYSSPISIGATTTLKAIAYKSGLADSAVTTASYTINFPTAATPSFSPAGGTFASAQSVTITSTTTGATIRYTVNGSTPSPTNGTVYSGAITIGATTTLKAIAYQTDFNASAVATAVYTINTVPTTVTFQAESLSPAGTGATVSTPADANASGGYWVALNADVVGDYVTMNTPAIVAGTYQLKFAYKGYTARGQCTVSVDGVQIGGTVEEYSATTVYPTVTLGNVTFATATTHTIRLSVTGKNAASTAYTLAADAFTFTPATAPAKFAIAGAAVTASANDGNVPANTVDGNLATRWSAQGDPQWIQYDLGSTKTVGYVRVAWLNGDTRTSTFDVLVSTNGTSWATALTGAQNPATAALSSYDFTDVSARYVRIVGHGNSVNTWNSITETEVWGF